jgi:GNAT superfamily N-acetyltransferase
MLAGIRFRPGTLEDSYRVFVLFEYTLSDLSHRLGLTSTGGPVAPEHLAKMWLERRSLYEHLARTAEQFWVAEQAGQIVGYARSILRADVRQLTEFFVLPDVQSDGLGRELIERAFPAEGADRRTLNATTDVRALALYLKNGMTPYCPLLYFGRTPEKVVLKTGLEFEALESSQTALDHLAEIDRQIIGFRRDVDYTWLMGNRKGFLIRREGQVVGYGFTGLRSGPFALLEPEDFPVALAYAERLAVDLGLDHFGLEVPALNRAAVEYLLGRGFRMDGFIALQMSDRPLPALDRYILTAPPFFL